MIRNLAENAMLIAVWALGLLLLVLWSAAMWAAHVGWTMLAALPWSQAVEAAQRIELPAWLELWIGSAWRDWLSAAGPMIEWVMRTLQGSAHWLEGMVPILMLVMWAAGALCVLVLTVLAAGLVSWWRGRHGPTATA
jgi:hypothetical protein